VTNDTGFRSPEQEVLRLLEEFVELRRTLKGIGAQLSRMESRVQMAFPAVAARSRQRTKTSAIMPSIPREEALAEYDRIVRLAASGANKEAERTVEEKSANELPVIAQEIGVIFPKSKPSLQTMRDAIIRKVRESVLLSRHHTRA
jgi:hypothetical protein